MTVAPARMRPSSSIRSVPLTLLLAVLASCAPTIVPEPGGRRPAATPVPSTAAPLATPSTPDWQDWPMTPGTWSYTRASGSTIARFASSGVVHAWVRCDLASHVVAIGRSARSGEVSGMMTVRTTFGSVDWPARTVTGPTPGVEAVRSAGDTGLDQIAFSRGRFALMLRDQPPVLAPTWAEPVRVVEDCRG